VGQLVKQEEKKKKYVPWRMHNLDEEKGKAKTNAKGKDGAKFMTRACGKAGHGSKKKGIQTAIIYVEHQKKKKRGCLATRKKRGTRDIGGGADKAPRVDQTVTALN